MTEPNEDQTHRSFHRTLTVGNVREPDPAGNIEVIFLESARFHHLLKNNPSYAEILKTLRTAERERRPVSVKTASIESDIIEDLSLIVP